jgi:bifunctional lysine-specific demethylase and histidyl-hydroxylase NO66
VREGEPIDPAAWTRRARTGAMSIDDLLDGGRALELFSDGATVVLQSLQRWWAPVAAFCADLERSLGHAVQANAYLTPGGATGLAPHHDTHDVFVLQVHGTKHWTVREAIVDAPLGGQRSDHAAAARQPVLFDAVLAPGDVLYLPRGVVHSASAQDRTSLHLTIGVLATTATDVLRRIVATATEDPRFRRALAPGWSGDEQVALDDVTAVIAELRRWLDDLDPTEVAGALRARWLGARRPWLAGQLLELDGLGAIDDGTVVRRRAGWPAQVSAGDDGRLVVAHGTRLIDLPAVLGPAIDRLLGSGPDGVPVADLSDLLDTSSRLVLVRRLVREGILQTSAPDG